MKGKNKSRYVIDGESPQKNHSFALVALDVDGTLLNSKRELTKENLKAARAVREAGVQITLATGRSLFSVRSYLEQLEINIPFVGLGGAEIIDPVLDRVIDRRPLDQADLECLVHKAREMQLAIFFYLPDGIYCEAPPEALDGLKPGRGYRLNMSDDILAVISEPPGKVSIYGKYEKLSQIESKIESDGCMVHAAYPTPEFLDVTRRDANKGVGLTRLAQILGISTEEILAIGDADNDLTMFEVAGLAVAMGNAAPEVKAAADVVAPSNDEDGVAWTLREIVLSQACDD